MFRNRVKCAWESGKPAINGWLSIPSPFVAEIMARHGFDSLTIDTQHGVIEYANTVTMLQAMHAYDVSPLIRVSWLDAGIIMKMLDAGAAGIICPMINNRKEAEELVSYVRYPPEGTRSFGPIRSLICHGADYFSRANDEIICLAMVETAEGFANLEEIVTTPGLDGIYIGPADLSLGLSNGSLPPGLDREEPEMIDAIRKIQSVCSTAGIRSGLHTGSADYAVKAVGWGFDLVTLLSDARLLDAAATSHVSEVRQKLALDSSGVDTINY